MILITQQQLAELRSCACSTVSRAILPHTIKLKKNYYDLSDPIVKAWALENYVKEQNSLTPKLTEADPKEKELADLQKVLADIKIKEEQYHRLKLISETTAKHLIPVDLLGIYIEHFAAGIKDNFLVVGNRVARGDVKLRNKIEKEIKIAIEKTLTNAERGLDKGLKKIIKEAGKK